MDSDEGQGDIEEHEENNKSKETFKASCAQLVRVGLCVCVMSGDRCPHASATEAPCLQDTANFRALLLTVGGVHSSWGTWEPATSPPLPYPLSDTVMNYERCFERTIYGVAMLCDAWKERELWTGQNDPQLTQPIYKKKCPINTCHPYWVTTHMDSPFYSKFSFCEK